MCCTVMRCDLVRQSIDRDIVWSIVKWYSEVEHVILCHDTVRYVTSYCVVLCCVAYLSQLPFYYSTFLSLHLPLFLHLLLLHFSFVLISPLLFFSLQSPSYRLPAPLQSESGRYRYCDEQATRPRDDLLSKKWRNSAWKRRGRGIKCIQRAGVSIS